MKNGQIRKNFKNFNHLNDIKQIPRCIHNVIHSINLKKKQKKPFQIPQIYYFIQDRNMEMNKKMHARWYVTQHNSMAMFTLLSSWVQFAVCRI